MINDAEIFKKTVEMCLFITFCSPIVKISPSLFLLWMVAKSCTSWKGWFIPSIYRLSTIQRSKISSTHSWFPASSMSSVEPGHDRTQFAMENKSLSFLIGTSWKIIENHGKFWNIIENHRTSWKIIEKHGTSKKIIETHGKSYIEKS